MARVTAVQDRLDLTVEEARLYARIDNDVEDTLVEELLNAGKAAADEFLGNPFTERGVELPIPGPIKTWVLQYIVWAYERRSLNLSNQATSGVGSNSYEAGPTPDTRIMHWWRKIPMAF